MAESGRSALDGFAIQHTTMLVARAGRGRSIPRPFELTGTKAERMFHRTWKFRLWSFYALGRRSVLDQRSQSYFHGRPSVRYLPLMII